MELYILPTPRKQTADFVLEVDFSSTLQTRQTCVARGPIFGLAKGLSANVDVSVSDQTVVPYLRCCQACKRELHANMACSLRKVLLDVSHLHRGLSCG